MEGRRVSARRFPLVEGCQVPGPYRLQDQHGARWFEGERVAGEESRVRKVSWRSLACRLVA